MNIKNLNITSIINTEENTETHLLIELKSVFIEIMLGEIMLGDGSLYRSLPTSNVRFKIS